MLIVPTMDTTLIRKHLRPRWIPEKAIDPAITPELLQMAVDEGLVEVRRDDQDRLEARIAPHHTTKTAASCWVSHEELAQIRLRAAAAGMSVSNLIRTALEACDVLKPAP